MAIKKVLRPEVAAAIGAQRFLREVQIAAHLAHPHILPLLDSGEADGFLYYVMPYLAGETLRDRLGRGHQLPVGEAVGIVRELADGLWLRPRASEYVHRDIKPENILFMAGHPVVANFGMAAIGVVGGRHPAHARLEWPLGTPMYMSPEQVTGQDEVDRPQRHLLALGCVLYEMLAGEPPFSARNAPGVLTRKLERGRPTRLSDRRETFHLAWDEGSPPRLGQACGGPI